MKGSPKKRKKVLDVILGAIFSNQSMLATIFAHFFKEFVKVYRDFARILQGFDRILRNFSRNFTKSKLLGVRFPPCTPAPTPVHRAIRIENTASRAGELLYEPIIISNRLRVSNRLRMS